MTPHDQQLVSGYLDESLTRDQQLELEHALESDDALLRYFAEETHLHRQLFDAMRNRIEAPAVSMSLWTRVRQGGTPEWMARSTAAAILLVALGFYGSFALLAWNLRPTDRGPALARVPSADRTEHIAVFTQGTDCRWSSESASPQPGDQLKPGKLQLLSGLAELQFESGVRLLLQGPAELTLASANSSYLHRGQIRARVPAQATGFTIESDAATVVDLGTEFSMNVSSAASVNVQVYEGKVELRATYEDRSLASEPIVLTAGMARRVERSESSGSASTAAIDWQVNGAPSLGPSGIAQLRVGGVMASSEFPLREAANLINGSGLAENAHASDPNGTMWHSALGRVKNEFVLFDFTAPRRLHSIRIWNYNERADRLFTSRGAAKASIYVSSSGKWDPFKEPREWQCVVRDHTFKTATGEDTYSEYEEVPLGGVAARFVAIVIDNHFGPDPRMPHVAQQQCVGLSEVQFFGERIASEHAGIQDAP